jgi:hypothetical protein
MWAEFPVTQTPRSLVFIGPRYRISGFRSGAAKQAFLAGAIDALIDLPVGLLDPLPARRQDFSGTPIAVVAAAPGNAEFNTDRGLQNLPAWRLTITDLREQLLLLSPEVRGWWAADPDAELSRRAGTIEARLAPDNVGLEMTIPGGRHDDLRIEFSETMTAVVYEPVFVPRQRPEFTNNGVATSINMALLVRRISTVLPSPLGSRVLINLNGAPVAVLPA